MSDIDYCAGRDRIDSADGKPRQLRFRFYRQRVAPPGSSRIFEGTGQLIAVVAKANHAENGDEIAISRPEVRRDEVEAAIKGFEIWATRYVGPGTKRIVDLALIRDRIRAAGLT